jgi:hypothetical protein
MVRSLGKFDYANERYDMLVHSHEINKTIAIVVIPSNKGFSTLTRSSTSTTLFVSSPDIIVSKEGKEYEIKNRNVCFVYYDKIIYFDFSQLEISEELLVHKNDINPSGIKAKIRSAMNDVLSDEFEK